MTKAQYDKKKNDLAKKYHAGDITPDEYNAELAALQAQFDYDQAKSAMFKKVQAGEVTNYAYIQWKKKNDPSKQAHSGPVSAPAAKKPMDDKDFDTIAAQLNKKKQNGEIDFDQWSKLGLESFKLYNAGASLEEAEVALGLKQPTKTETINPSGMTDEQKDKIIDYINQMAVDDTIDYDDANELFSMLDDLQKNGIGAAQVQDAVESAVHLISDNGMTGLEASMVAHADALAKAQNPPAQVTSSNAGADAADQAVEKLEKELKKVYKKAADELRAELEKHNKEFDEKNAKKQADLAAGKITKAEYDAWVKNQVAYGDLIGAKIEQMTDTMLAANQKAAAMVNAQTFNVFAENANFQSYKISKDAKINLSFAVYDEDTVRMLILNKPELLPRKVVNGAKDKAWNQKEIAAAVTQAILQGESIDKLAKRIANDTASSNMKSMVRYARTAMTGAQNSGRIEMLTRAKGMGIKVKKKWMATLDSRTRDSHQAMDGEVVDVEEKFSNGLMYPGDMGGKPGEVWNCRCTMVYVYEDFPNDPTKDPRIQYDEWDETVTVTKKDKNGKEYQTEKVIHHRDSSLITNMTYKEWKAAKQNSMLKNLNTAKLMLAQAQKEFVSAKVNENKVYKGLWKDDVTLADYPAKKDGIAAKRDYYTAEIEKMNQAIANGESWATPEKVKEFEQKRKLLNEYERHGKLLERRNAALKYVQDIYDKVGFQAGAKAPVIPQAETKSKTKASEPKAPKPKAPEPSKPASGQFPPDAWDEAKKKAATLYNYRKDADRDLRPELNAEWDHLTDAEKYAVWEYTHNSNPMNKSLSGYHEKWDRSYFLGYDKTVWGYEDSFRRLNVKAFEEFGKDGHVQYHKAITDLTKAIEKTTFKKDRWLVRGSDENGIAGMLEGAGMSFSKAKSLFSGGTPIASIKQALVGKQARNHAFTSTGIAKDSGFDGNIKYRIFCPAGTKGVYAEPQSYYGNTADDHLYKPGEYYMGVGSEAEVILQRGTTFVIRDIIARGREYEIVMEVTDQPNYFNHGDEDTYNGGKTRHKR